MVLIVLIAFAMGMIVGVLGMVPRWWRQKQAANTAQAAQASQTPNTQNQPQNLGAAPNASEPSHGT
jgi:hypothetical protein